VPDLNANRKRRLLARLDAALARMGVQPPRQQRQPAARTVERRERARTEAASSRRGWEELAAAIRREGGIRPTRDFPAREIPAGVRAGRGRGLAPDEMAQVLTARGFHYDGDDALIQDIQRRRDRLGAAREQVSRTRSRTTGPQTVCGPVARTPNGQFRRIT